MVFVFAVFIASHFLVSDMFFGAYEQPNKAILYNVTINGSSEADAEIFLVVLSWASIAYIVTNKLCIAYTGNGLLDDPTKLEC